MNDIYSLLFWMTWTAAWFCCGMWYERASAHRQQIKELADIIENLESATDQMEANINRLERKL